MITNEDFSLIKELDLEEVLCTHCGVRVPYQGNLTNCRYCKKSLSNCKPLKPQLQNKRPASSNATSVDQLLPVKRVFGRNNEPTGYQEQFRTKLKLSYRQVKTRFSSMARGRVKEIKQQECITISSDEEEMDCDEPCKSNDDTVGMNDQSQKSENMSQDVSESPVGPCHLLDSGMLPNAEKSITSSQTTITTVAENNSSVATNDNKANDAFPPTADIILGFNGVRKQLFTYPIGARQGIEVTTEDCHCLNQDEFLNDVIIEFYLKYIYLNKLNESDQDKSYIFNSFFYKSLCSPDKLNKELSLPERRHNKVRKWTRNVDLFSKEFIFIPINEAAHWFLAVVCFPQLVYKFHKRQEAFRQKNLLTNVNMLNIPNEENLKLECKTSPCRVVLTPMTEESIHLHGVNVSASNVQNQNKELKINNAVVVLSAIDDENIANHEEIKTEDVMDEKSEKEKQFSIIVHLPDVPTREPTMQENEINGTENNPKEPDKVFNEPANNLTNLENNSNESQLPNLKTEFAPETLQNVTVNENNVTNEYCPQPVILIFDSLRCGSKSKVASNLREYLTAEWNAKKSAEFGKLVFTKDNIKMCTPQVPQQHNYSDCGIFLLQYVETFFKNPINNFQAPIKHLKDWFDLNDCIKKREEIKQIINEIYAQQTSNIS